MGTLRTGFFDASGKSIFGERVVEFSINPIIGDLGVIEYLYLDYSPSSYGNPGSGLSPVLEDIGS